MLRTSVQVLNTDNTVKIEGSRSSVVYSVNCVVKTENFRKSRMRNMTGKIKDGAIEDYTHLGLLVGIGLSQNRFVYFLLTFFLMSVKISSFTTHKVIFIDVQCIEWHWTTIAITDSTEELNIIVVLKSISSFGEAGGKVFH